MCTISLSCPSVKMCLLEKAIAAKHLGTIKFLLYEDPSVFDHTLDCGKTVKEKVIELNFYEAIMKHLAKRDATEKDTA